MNARLVFTHAALLFRAIFRTPAFAVPAIVFPAMFYTIFALQFAKSSPAMADQVLGSYVAFGIMGVALFQFGVAISAERGRPWERYLRSLPVTAQTRFAARVIVATMFALMAGGLVALIGGLFTPVTFSVAQWLLLALYALAGAIPFVLIGLAIAYLIPPAGALPITNIVFMLGAFAGGMFIPPQFLPQFAQRISEMLPTRAYGELLWGVGLPGHNAAHWFTLLCVYAIVFAIVAVIAYRRDERVRYA